MSRSAEKPDESVVASWERTQTLGNDSKLPHFMDESWPCSTRLTTAGPLVSDI
jgi:hypothetical protein